MSAKNRLAKLRQKTKMYESMGSVQSGCTNKEAGHAIGASDAARNAARNGSPVRLPCGHFNWSYDATTGVCGECTTKVPVSVQDRIRGMVIELLVASEIGDRDRLVEAVDKVARMTGARESIEAIPSLLVPR